MKKKFSLWLNIATICLCVCAIAIGVYSAQSATLTVTGSVGFKAHDLDATVAVKMYGHATSQDGTPEESSSSFAIIQQETTITNNMTISLSTFYFTDMESSDGKAEDIVIEFTYKNKSAFEVLAKVTTAESSICDNTAVTAEVKNAYMAKGSSSSPTTGTMKITLQLDAGTETFSKDATVSINITLEKTTAKTYTSGTNQGKPVVVSKYTKEQQEIIWNNTVGKHSSSFSKYGYSTTSDSYATYFPYYITMGKSSTSVASDDIKWLIVGYKNADNKVAVLEDSDKAALSAGILLANKDYIALLAEGLKRQGFFSSSSYEDGINSNDYSLSAIRTYLSTGFASTYSLTDLSITIKPRALSELYADIDAKDSMSSSSADGQIKAQSAVTGEDKFWLLSQEEVYTIFNVDIKTTKYYSASITTWLGSTDKSPVNWWLRSPYSMISYYARIVSDSGIVDDEFLVDDGCSVRAAFQF